MVNNLINKTKKLFFIVIFIQLFSFNLVLAEEQQRVVRVGIYDNSPKIYKDDNGNIKGFWADITNYIALKENWNIVYVHDTWENGLEKLKNGQIDLMVDVAINEDREKIYDFNNETALISWGMFYKRDGIDINSLDDLNGKKIAILKSGILYSGSLGLKDIMTSFNIKADIVNVDIYDDVFKLLDSKQVDVGVVNNIFGLYNESKYKVNRTGIIIQPSELKYALNKNNPENNYLISTIDSDLKQIKEDLNSIYHKSMKSNFVGFLEKETIFPTWVKYLLIGVFSLLILSITIILILKKYQKKLKKEIEEVFNKMKSSEEKFHMIFDNAPDVIWLLKNGVFVDCNTMTLKLFNCSSKEDIINHTPMDFSPIKQPGNKDSKEEALKYINAALNNKPQVFNWNHQRKDGMPLYMEISLNKISLDGETYLLAVGRDKTEKRELEQTESRFLSIASHQLRTPLSINKWLLESLTEQGSLNSRQKSKINDLIYSNERLIHLVNNLLKVSAIDTGRFSVNEKYVDLEELIKKLFIVIDPILKKKEKNIKIIGSSEVKNVYCDPILINEVMENFLINAIDYSPEYYKEIIIECKGRDNDYLFSIHNDGAIDPITLERINKFERFVRGGDSAEKEPAGSGLGLYINKNMIEASGGKIWFESNSKSGTTFYFTILKKN